VYFPATFPVPELHTSSGRGELLYVLNTFTSRLSSKAMLSILMPPSLRWLSSIIYGSQTEDPSGYDQSYLMS
jgi:hypothetical protein